MKLQEIDGEPIGTASNFTIPATSNGVVYVGTLDGHVLGFGVTTGAALHRNAARGLREHRRGLGNHADRHRDRVPDCHRDRHELLRGHLTRTVHHRSGDRNLTERVRRCRLAFPVTLRSGDALHAPVTFAPAAPGGTNGAVSFCHRCRADVPVIVPLIADATRTGLYATAPSLSMLLSLNDGTEVGPVPVGLPEYAVSTIVNGGTSPQRITEISGPAPRSRPGSCPG